MKSIKVKADEIFKIEIESDDGKSKRVNHCYFDSDHDMNFSYIDSEFVARIKKVENERAKKE